MRQCQRQSAAIRNRNLSSSWPHNDGGVPEKWYGWQAVKSGG
jgi:hypothetical protein